MCRLGVGVGGPTGCGAVRGSVRGVGWGVGGCGRVCGGGGEVVGWRDVARCGQGPGGWGSVGGVWWWLVGVCGGCVGGVASGVLGGVVRTCGENAGECAAWLPAVVAAASVAAAFTLPYGYRFGLMFFCSVGCCGCCWYFVVLVVHFVRNHTHTWPQRWLTDSADDNNNHGANINTIKSVTDHKPSA